jgi:formyl-CoA transferase
VLGRQDLFAAPEFKDNEARAKNRAKLNEVLNLSFLGEDSKSWVDKLNQAGVPCGPIYKMDEVFADPQVKHIGAAAEVVHPRLGRSRIVAQPARLSRTPATVATATPEIGEHTDEVLQELKYGKDEIERLRKGGAV